MNSAPLYNLSHDICEWVWIYGNIIWTRAVQLGMPYAFAILRCEAGKRN